MLGCRRRCCIFCSPRSNYRELSAGILTDMFLPAMVALQACSIDGLHSINSTADKSSSLIGSREAEVEITKHKKEGGSRVYLTSQAAKVVMVRSVFDSNANLFSSLESRHFYQLTFGCAAIRGRPSRRQDCESIAFLPPRSGQHCLFLA
jgi:hypothetical protein